MELREKNKLNKTGFNANNANNIESANRTNKLRSFLRQMKTGENIDDRIIEKETHTERGVYSNL